MTSVAAQTMAWQRRARNRPGPLSPATAPSGDSPNGNVLQVELLIDGLWTDITSRVMTRQGNGQVQITRGEPNEGSQTEASVCRLELNNRDGLFSARNPLSAYYGKLSRNQEIRVSVPSGNAKSYRFWGEVSSWPQFWDPSGKDVAVQIVAGGILRRLGQGSQQLDSPMRTFLADGNTAQGGSPVYSIVVAYWPCEDSVSATSIASDYSGFPPMAITGTPSLASYSGFVCSGPIPTFKADSSFRGVVPAYAQLAVTLVRFLVLVPSGGLTEGQVLCSVYTTGTVARWDVYYDVSNGTGTIGVHGYNSSGTVVGSIVPFGNSLNGNQAQISLSLSQSGPDISMYFGSNLLGQLNTFINSGTASAQTLGLVTSVVIAPNAGLANTVFGQVIVETTDETVFDPSELNGPLSAWSGERADDRFYRLCAIGSLKFEQIGLEHGTVTMGNQTIAKLLDLLQECITADNAIMYELMTGIGLGIRTRQSLENQPAALTLDYSLGQLAAPPAPVDDDRYARNDITVSRVGGSSAHAVQADGPLSVSQPPAGVGRVPDTVTVNIDLDSDLVDQAWWRLHLGTVDEARYPQISVNLAHQQFVTNPVLRQQVLSVRPGDRIVIINPPAWLPPDQISQLVIGYSETIDNFQHRVTLNCVPESPYHIALVDDPVLCRLDTGGAMLAAGAQATDVTLQVATTTGQLWTTNAADFPFDIRISGEQITVTNISGATSPQTFTVTRGVNGVVKALPINADVRLNQPMTLATGPSSP